MSVQVAPKVLRFDAIPIRRFDLKDGDGFSIVFHKDVHPTPRALRVRILRKRDRSFSTDLAIQRIGDVVLLHNPLKSVAPFELWRLMVALG